MPQGHGSAVMLGDGSEGDRLQKTLYIARVLAQFASWRWLGNLNEGFESGSSVFHHRRSSARASASSHVLVVSAKRQGTAEVAPHLVRVSAHSFPLMLQWEGYQVVEISQPSRLRSLIISRARRVYSWLCLLNCSVSSAARLSTQIIAMARGAVVVRRDVTASWIALSSASYTSAQLSRWQLPSPSR